MSQRRASQQVSRPRDGRPGMAVDWTDQGCRHRLEPHVTGLLCRLGPLVYFVRYFDGNRLMRQEYQGENDGIRSKR